KNSKAGEKLVAKVKSGELTVKQARAEANRASRHARKEANARAVADIKRSGPVPWEIIRGDCIPVMGKIEPGSVRLVFADPKYNQNVDYGPHCNDRMDPADYRDWCAKWIKAAARVLTPDGSLWVLIPDRESLYFGPMIDDAGLHHRQTITW